MFLLNSYFLLNFGAFDINYSKKNVYNNDLSLSHGKLVTSNDLNMMLGY